MKQFTIEVTVDRPGNGLDTIVSEMGELTSANLKEVGERLQTVFDSFESEESEVKFAGTATVTDEAGDVSVVTATNVKKGTIQAIIIAIQEINQTPPIYVPPVEDTSLVANDAQVSDDSTITEDTSEQTPPIIKNPGDLGEQS